jgi:mono/diheme cytochrome c family protein
MTIKTKLALSFAGALLIGAVAVRAQDAPGGGPTSVEISSEGREVYEMICQACHMADGRGGDGAGAAIPAIADNANLADKDFVVDILVKGRGGMPWFTDMLTPEQIAAVSTYARSHFNKYPDPVTTADVQRIAGAVASPTKDCSTC